MTLNKVKYKKIKLTRGKYAIVSSEDFLYLNKFKWCALLCRGSWTAKRNDYSSGVCKIIYMHRLIMNAPKGSKIDHKDRNSLNNQRSNLRFCTHSQNGKNRKASGRSKYLGVSWSVKDKKWVSYLRNNGVRFYLGCFDKEKDAAKAYDLKAKIEHGEFANLNFKQNGSKRIA